MKILSSQNFMTTLTIGHYSYTSRKGDNFGRVLGSLRMKSDLQNFAWW